MLNERVMAGAAIKKPLVLDIEGQFPDNIHIDTIAHSGIRGDLRPKDWAPAKYSNWNVTASEIAEKAFKRGHDALVLTNTADGKTHTIRANGLEKLTEGRLPSLSEYYLIEAVDLDRTWETHKDAIMKRVQEADHYHVMQPDHTGQVKSTGQISAQMYHNTMAFRRGDKVMDRPLNDNRTFRPIYRDQHEAAQPLQAAIDRMKSHNVLPGDQKFADADIERGKHAFMDMVKQAAPHPKYIPTIVKMYANGSIKRMEDIPTQAAEAFGKYHKLATHGRLKATKKVALNGFGKLMSIDSTLAGNEHMDSHAANHGDRKPIPETDFRRFDNLADVRAVVDHHDHKKFLAGDTKAAAKGQFTVVHDDDDVTVYHPHTWEASKALAVCPHTGQKAAWCTAADSVHGKRYFEQYSKDGALLIYHPKAPLHDGEMYQTHHASNQFMDEHDNEHNFYRQSSRTPDIGLEHPDSMHESSEGRVKARFPGFNSKSALTYTYNHMYDHPEKYDSGAAKHYEDDNVGVMGVRHGRVLKHTFENHFHSRSPDDADGEHWRRVTADEAKASRAEAEAKGKAYFPATHTVKDHAAYEAAKEHHRKVQAHFLQGDWYHDEEDDDR